MDEEGFVYATDQVKPIVQKFGPNGDYIESIKIEYPAVGIAALKTGEFIVNCLSPEFAFYLYDKNGCSLDTKIGSQLLHFIFKIDSLNTYLS